MRAISCIEIAAVSGGGDVSDAATVGGALGGAAFLSAGVSSGLAGAELAMVTAFGTAVGAGVFAAGAGGFAIGSLINEYTGIQSYLSNSPSFQGALENVVNAANRWKKWWIDLDQ